MNLVNEIELADAEATTRLGAALARRLRGQGGAVIHLEGDLGAGKTTLARGFLRELGVTGTVRSPTYTLMEPYETAQARVLHMDLYRLTDPLELENLGLNDFPPAQTLWLVEWPDKGGALLPRPDLRLLLGNSGTGRRLRIEAAASLAGRVAGLSAGE